MYYTHSVYSFFSLFVILFFTVLLGTSPCNGNLSPQDVSVPFWEPLPFADLPELITSRCVFYQDNSTQGKLYTIAGDNTDSAVSTTNTFTNAVYEMNIATETWRRVPTRGDNLTARVYNVAEVLTHPNTGASYVATYGGFKIVPVLQVGLIADFAVLDLATFTWTNKGMPYTQVVASIFNVPDRTCCSTCNIGSCPVARAASGGVVFNSDRSKLYLLGGESYNGAGQIVALQDLWMYDITTDAWTQMTITNSLTQPRFSSAVVALSKSSTKRILQFGGIYFTYPTALPVTNFATNELIMLEETSTNVWKYVTVIAANAFGPPTRANPFYVVVNTLFLIWGGETSASSAIAGPMWALDTNRTDYTTWNWTTIAIASGQFEPPGRAGSGLVYVPTQSALVGVGGNDATSAASKHLFKFHALGLLPPVQRFIGSDVSEGYDFNGATQTVSEFNDTSPNINFVDRTTRASLVGAVFGRLVELDGTNTQVAELLLPPSEFIVGYELLDTTTNRKVTVFTRHGVDTSAAGVVNNAVTVRIEFYQFDVDTTIDQSPLPPFPLPAGDIKFNIRLGNWPFQSSANTLRFELSLNFNENNITTNTTTTTFGTSYTFNYPSGSQVQLNVVSTSLNDNVTQPVTYTTALTQSSLSLALNFQSFVNTLYYDPSFGVLVDTSSSSGGGGGGGDGTDNVAIIVGVVVSFAFVTFVIFAVIITVLVTAYLTRQKWIQRRASISDNIELDNSEA